MDIKVETITQLPKKHPVALAAYVIAMIFAVLIFMGSGKVAGLREELDDQKRDLSAIERNNINGRNLDQDLEQLNSFLDEVNNELLDPAEKPFNSQLFYNFEKEANVTFILFEQKDMENSYTIGPGKQVHFRYIPFELTFRGSFSNVMKFFMAMEGSPYHYRYRKILVSKSENTLDPREIVVNLSLDALANP